MRLDRPIGTWLLLLPGWWAIALGYRETPDLGLALYLAALFGVGAVVMRGCGCVINDLYDRDLDACVARTATRPLVTGAASVRAAVLFAGVLALMGLNILALMPVAAWLVAIASVPFILIYPLMKRITWWPQLFLGLTFNFGALIGYAAMTGGIGAPAILLYLAGIFWTLGYDTIYAHQDRVDDERVGVRSSARALGPHSGAAIKGFYGLATLLIFMALYEGAASLAVLPAIVVIAVGFWAQTRRFQIDDPDGCLALFKKNRDQGLMILAMIILCAWAA